MQVEIDEHVNATLEFMEPHIPASKLCGVAESIPELARLLWSHIQQEPCVSLNLGHPKMAEANQTRSASIESSLVPACADGDFVVEGACR